MPTTATIWVQPSSHSRMEWVGGTDNDWAEGWMAIADPAADMFLVKQTATVAGNSRLGGAFEWRGSNANGSLTPDLVSYSRTATYTFYSAGGYVAQAAHFRDFATAKGWNVSLIPKNAANSDVNKLLGAPVIYLWGDGRSDTMLNALSSSVYRRFFRGVRGSRTPTLATVSFVSMVTLLVLHWSVTQLSRYFVSMIW